MTRIKGVNVHYRQEGQGDPIVLLHGFMGYLGTFSSIWDTLVKGHELIALDLPGFGLSEKDTNFDYSKANLADVVAAFLEERGIHEAVIIGHSMGGEVGQHLAIRHPSLVKKLVLVDTGGRYKRQQRAFIVQARGRWVRMILKNLFSTYFIQHLFTRMSVHSKFNPDQDWVRRSYAVNRRIPPETLMKFIADNRDPVSIPDPKKIKSPTLIVWGKEDRLIPVSYARNYQMDIRKSVLVVLPDCGHIPFLENPVEFLEQLERFISV